MIAEIAQRRGIIPDGYCFFNDVRFNAAQRIVPDQSMADELASTIDFALPDTVVSVPSMANRPKGANFFMFLNEIADSAVLTLCVEEDFLPPRGPEGFLRDLEQLMVRGAKANLPAGELCATLISDHRALLQSPIRPNTTR
jgi:hypothetical protein